MNNKKLLINTPHFELFGGVASYYNVLKPFLNDRADFLFGSRGENKFLKKIGRVFIDFFFFLKKIRKNDYELVLLNPSFDPKSIFRDGFFFYCQKL